MYALGTFPHAFLLSLQHYFIWKPPTPFKIVTDLSFIQADLDYNVDPMTRRTITLTADMVIKGTSDNRFLSFDDLMEFEEYQYLEHLDSRVYQAFPQPIDHVETYGHLVPKESIGESMVTNFDKRQKIRELQRGREGKNLMVKNSIRYTFVFSVGYPSKRSDDDFETGDEIAVSPSSSRFGNVSTDLDWWYDKMHLLSDEVEKKTRPIVLLVDSNKLFSADNLARALSVLNPVQSDTLFYGEMVKNQEVKLEGYWFASKTEEGGFSEVTSGFDGIRLQKELLHEAFCLWLFLPE
ncbi:hypothetical protein Aperf_G00000081908 [Anoplocephala perfoliata]